MLLLDEADVFLQARDKEDMRRNSVVSVFLRVLEYYSGSSLFSSISELFFALFFALLKKEVEADISGLDSLLSIELFTDSPFQQMQLQ